jgi:hypothetical protein
VLSSGSAITAAVETSSTKKAKRAIASGWLGATLAGGVESGVEQQHALTSGAGFAGGAGPLVLPEQQQQQGV